MRTISENHFSFSQSYARMKLVYAVWRKRNKTKKIDTTMSWNPVHHTASKQVISSRWLEDKVDKMYKRLMKNARAKPAKRRLIFVKYVNLWRSCSSRRHDYLGSSLQSFPHGSPRKFESYLLLITKKETFSPMEANL